MDTFIGIDVGTSACRACAINDQLEIIGEARADLPEPLRENHRVEQAANLWWQSLTESLDRLVLQADTGRVRRIAIDATSSTLLLCRKDGTPLTPGLMYNDARASREAERIDLHAPVDSAARGASSSLAKLLHLRSTIPDRGWLALHQADWLSGKLTGRFGVSDENNVLKLGYDPVRREWPAWLQGLEIDPDCLPEIVTPGATLGTVPADLAARWHWPDPVEVAAGTTDSTAGFIATGAVDTGTAVTSLGSTLVLKVLSEQPVFAARYGVYSHRLGERWLVGGASNSGGSVLRQLFTESEIDRFTRLLKPGQATGLDYYPLSAAGERFPLQNPHLQPRLEPRPAAREVFFQGILEGMARIEQRGYELLTELGAPWPERVLTVGGGAGNRGWTEIRSRLLGVPVQQAARQEAAYGAALLARGSQ